MCTIPEKYDIIDIEVYHKGAKNAYQIFQNPVFYVKR